jgi:DNA-binding HxlR family transcriptional regulator
MTPRPAKHAPARTPADTAADVFVRYPGSGLVMSLLADKWTIPVIHALARGTKRTGELKAELGTVSQKMLTQTLRMLELTGLVERKVFPVVPPRVEYSLTRMGESINEPLSVLCDWVETHGAALAAMHARRVRASARKSQT